MMKAKYLTLDLMTLDDVVKCDHLMRRGWRVYRSGLFTVVLTNK